VDTRTSLINIGENSSLASIASNQAGRSPPCASNLFSERDSFLARSCQRCLDMSFWALLLSSFSCVLLCLLRVGRPSTGHRPKPATLVVSHSYRAGHPAVVSSGMWLRKESTALPSYQTEHVPAVFEIGWPERGKGSVSGPCKAMHLYFSGALARAGDATRADRANYNFCSVIQRAGQCSAAPWRRNSARLFKRPAHVQAGVSELRQL
jgi:hypothetical protein